MRVYLTDASFHLGSHPDDESGRRMMPMLERIALRFVRREPIDLMQEGIDDLRVYGIVHGSASKPDGARVGTNPLKSLRFTGEGDECIITVGGREVRVAGFSDDTHEAMKLLAASSVARRMVGEEALGSAR